jgi:hypothetical protein
MKKIAIIPIVLLIVGLLGLTVLAGEQNKMSVQVKEGAVRSSPSFLAKIIAKLDYGDQVVVKEEKSSWSKIELTGVYSQGWIHSSALSSKKIIVNPGDADVDQAASDDELTLAGRGFNQEVEQKFRSQNPDVDFTWIDRMEKMVVSQDQIQNFIQSGGLNPQFYSVGGIKSPGRYVMKTISRRKFLGLSGRLAFWGLGIAPFVSGFIQGCKIQVGSVNIDTDSIVKSYQAVSKSFEDITPQQEYYIGRTVGARILQKYKPYDNPAANRYVNTLGQTLAQASDRAKRSPRHRIFRRPMAAIIS